ncbi:hypothetical protein VNO77_02193 [Canavalia gladiata]|uniref:RNase H type-1 domain-containing protein n=1 Tax=Canavalia gladiata TaxID=3824 RepID=A0AAN9MTA9_CANGL
MKASFPDSEAWNRPHVNRLNVEGSSLGNLGRVGFVMVPNGFHRRAVYACIITKIKKSSFIALEWNVVLEHTLCEANQCADWLSKNGSSSNAVSRFGNHVLRS